MLKILFKILAGGAFGWYWSAYNISTFQNSNVLKKG